MILSKVEFPQRIIKAVDSKKLTIFAGAGVSMGAPSLLPSFWKLAKELAAGTDKSLKVLGTGANSDPIYEPFDQFLGRLPLNLSSLREKTSAIIKTDNQHNELHKSLIRLFGEPSNVRLVTTNYDLMFESAAMSLWQEKPDIYCAPALPVGSSFEGIVHVHGSVDRPSGIVLTDSDFGKAYLIEGWARRFLVDVFTSQNTTLFVGYSYEDTVLQYLARALPNRSEKNRFALIDSKDDQEKWRLLGIEPVLFTKPHDTDYSILYKAVKELANYATRKPSEWQEKIKHIAENSPLNADIEDEDKIRSALKDEARTRFFTQVATDPEWINWLIRELAFLPIFESESPGNHSIELANWLIKEFLFKHPDNVMQVLASNRQPIKYWFWWKLAHEVRGIEDPASFSKFFDYLIQVKPQNADIHALQFLGEKCDEHKDLERLLVVFKEMTSSQISLSKPYSFTGNERPYRHDLEIVSPHWNLEQVAELLSSYFDTHGERILNFCEETLLNRKIISDSWWQIDNNWDVDSDRRSSIEPHEQDKYPEAIDIVIDTARVTLESMAQKYPKYVEHWINTRSNSNSHLVRRLAIHAIGNLASLNADEKIHMIISIGIFNSIHRHESFVLLKKEFPKAKIETKKIVIAEVLRHKEQEKENTMQVHFDWLNALQESDPSSKELQKALENMSTAFSSLEKSKYPGLSSWSEVTDYAPESPYSANELLSDKGPSFKAIVDFHSEPFPSGKMPSRSGLTAAVRDAADRDRKWGVRFLLHLIENNDLNSDYIPPLLSAIGKWTSSLEDAKSLLKLLQNEQIQVHFPRSIADIILEAVRSGGLDFICEILPLTNEIADAVMNQIKTSSSPISGDDVDWFTKCVNTTEGLISEYWVHALSIQVNKCGERVFEEPYISALTRLIDTNLEASKYTIPAVTQQLSFLHGVSEKWVCKHIVPLFNENNQEILAQAWHGYLASNGPRKNTFKLLEGAFEKALIKLDQLLGKDRKNRFIDFLTVSIFWYVEKPNENWIPKLISKLDSPGRITFAHCMSQLLRTIEEEKKDDSWNVWIKEYWYHRKSDAPIQLNDDEVNVMLTWIPHLGNMFPEAVDVAISIPSNLLEKYSVIHELGTSGLVGEFPNDMAKLVTYFLKCKTDTFYLHQLEDKILLKLKKHDLEPSILQALNEALIQSGRKPLK